MVDAGDSLVALFLEALPPASAATPPGELGAALDEALAAARLAWPALEVPPEAFARYLAARLPPAADLGSATRSLYAADLYLACACDRGDTAAIAAFDARYMPEIDRALERLRVAPLIADDLKGGMREKLFFPKDGDRSLLAGYSGRGEIGAWLRAVAVRAARKTLRPARATPAEREAEFGAGAPGADPELGYLRATFAAESTSALAEAIAELPVRDRNLLRQYYIDGLTVDQLGKLYRVHRATAARWVTDVRDALVKDVQRRLMRRLRLDENELKSVMRAARSQLDLSIQRLLQPKDNDPAGVLWGCDRDFWPIARRATVTSGRSPRPLRRAIVTSGTLFDRPRGGSSGQ
jgi:RNA polymerase sigma-70 factor, ECF subfamily